MNKEKLQQLLELAEKEEGDGKKVITSVYWFKHLIKALLEDDTK